MTGSSRYPIRTSMVYPPPSNNRASVACTFEDATRIRTAEKRSVSSVAPNENYIVRTATCVQGDLSSATIRWQLKSQQMRILLSVLNRIFFEQFCRPQQFFNRSGLF